MHLGPQEPDHQSLVFTLRAISDNPEAFHLSAVAMACRMASDALDGLVERIPSDPQLEGQTSIYDHLEAVSA